MKCDQVPQIACPARLSSDAATIHHTRSGLVVGTKLGTVIRPAHGTKAGGGGCLSSGDPRGIVRFGLTRRHGHPHSAQPDSKILASDGAFSPFGAARAQE